MRRGRGWWPFWLKTIKHSHLCSVFVFVPLLASWYYSIGTIGFVDPLALKEPEETKLEKQTWRVTMNIMQCQLTASLQ